MSFCLLFENGGSSVWNSGVFGMGVRGAKIFFPLIGGAVFDYFNVYYLEHSFVFVFRANNPRS